MCYFGFSAENYAAKTGVSWLGLITTTPNPSVNSYNGHTVFQFVGPAMSAMGAFTIIIRYSDFQMHFDMISIS